MINYEAFASPVLNGLYQFVTDAAPDGGIAFLLP